MATDTVWSETLVTHPGEPIRENYVVEHTVGSIIRGAFRIYTRHFATLFFIYVLPVLPLAMLQERRGVRTRPDCSFY